MLSEAVVAGGAHVGEHVNRLAPFSEPVGQAVLARCELDEMKARTRDASSRTHKR